MHSTEKIRELTHNLALKYIENYYPGERPYFDLVWNEFLHLKTDALKERKRFLGRFGLRFAAERIELVSPLVVLVIKAVLTESESFERSPDQKQFQKAVSDVAIAFGVDAIKSRQLADRLAPELHRLFCKLAETQLNKKDSLPEQSERAPYGCVFADWLFNGEHCCGQIIPKTDMLQLKRSNARECTFAVDETSAKFEIFVMGALRPIEKNFDKVPGMLWLAMTHVGAKIPFKKIRDLFNLSPDPKDNSVYMPRNQLTRFFGDGWNRNFMQESPRLQRYFVADEGWSFYWFRSEKNPRFSDLVHYAKKSGRLAAFDLSYYEEAMEAHQSLPKKPRENQ